MMSDSFEKLNTRVYSTSSAKALPEALAILRGGGNVVFPTDTVYGVGCDLVQTEAIERLYWAKRRPKRLAIPILVSEPAQVSQVARDPSPLFDILAARFWPGGLTLILPRHPTVPVVLCAGGDTIAVRMPDHPFALRLIAAMGGALAATSANLSGRPSPRSASEALADLNGRVALLLDGGECPGGVASTIVDLVSDPPVLLRQGGLEVTTLRDLLPDLVVPRS